MKIAMITPHGVKCGIFSYSRDLSEALAKKGVEVYIIRLPRFGRKTPAILQKVIDQIPVQDVDLIHVQHEYGLYNNLEGGFYAGLKLLRMKLVSTMHAVGNLTIDRVVDAVSDKVIVHNEFCKKRFRFKSELIPHGCKSSETMPREEAMKILGIDPRIPLVGYCGFISSYKGLESLIEAISRIPKSAILIGGGWHTGGSGTQYIASINEMSRRLLSHRCKWLGFVPDEDLPMVYGAMDVVVYPSIYATESGALLMAMGHGKAVIANRLPPFKEKEKLGALTTFRGVNSLVKKIRKVLKDEEYRASLEAGAREYAENNSWSSIATMHMNLYDEVLSRTE